MTTNIQPKQPRSLLNQRSGTPIQYNQVNALFLEFIMSQILKTLQGTALPHCALKCCSFTVTYSYEQLTYVLLTFWCHWHHWIILTILVGSCYVVIDGRDLAGDSAGALALRRLAGILALSRLVLARLALALGWLLRLTRPSRWVGRINAAPHAAAKLQPPHVPNHGSGIERLLWRA